MSGPPPARRHARIVVGLALVIGSVLLGLALRFDRGSTGFYFCSLAVAVVWVGASARVRAGAGLQIERPQGQSIEQRTGPDTSPRAAVAAGAAVGAVMFGVFVVGAEIGRHFSFLADPIDAILRKADGGATLVVLGVALVNGVAEELFFRGALIDVVGVRRRRTFVIAVLIYIAVTSVSGNTALTVAAAVMGTVFALERWWIRGLAAPITTHLVWSTLMILALPR